MCYILQSSDIREPYIYMWWLSVFDKPERKQWHSAISTQFPFYSFYWFLRSCSHSKYGFTVRKTAKRWSLLGLPLSKCCLRASKTTLIQNNIYHATHLPSAFGCFVGGKQPKLSLLHIHLNHVFLSSYCTYRLTFVSALAGVHG